MILSLVFDDMGSFFMMISDSPGFYMSCSFTLSMNCVLLFLHSTRISFYTSLKPTIRI